MRPDLARDHLESQRQQTVTGQDGRRLVKRPVAGRPATPQVVVVHRRQIVVDQRIGVNHLQRTSRRQRRLSFAAARFGRHQAQDRTQPLATPQHSCNASPSPAAPDTPPPSARVNLGQVAAQGLLDPQDARSRYSPSADTSIDVVGELVMFPSFQPFQTAHGAQIGRTPRFRNDELMAQHPRLGNAFSSVFHTRATSYASLLLTFDPRKSTQDPRKLCNAKLGCAGLPIHFTRRSHLVV